MKYFAEPTLGVGIFALCVCAAVCAQSVGQPTSNPLLEDAAQSLAAGNLGRAESELLALLKSTPTDHRALNFLGLLRAQQQRNAEAERLFRQAISIKPDFPSAHINLGLLYVQMGEPETAIPQLEEGLRLDPNRSDAANALADIWRQQARAAETTGNPEKALSLLLQARKVAPRRPDVEYEFGMVALRMSLVPDAIQAFQQTLALRDNDANARYALGRAYMESSDFENARQQFQKYLEFDSMDATAHYALGMALSALERAPEARVEFEKSVSLMPVQTESYFRLGVLDLQSKNFDSAEKNFEHVLGRDPKHAGALAGLGRAKFEEKKYPEARDRLLEAISSNDKLREAHYYLGLTYARMGRKEDADHELAIATRLEHEETERQRTVFRILNPESAARPEALPQK